MFTGALLPARRSIQCPEGPHLYCDGFGPMTVVPSAITTTTAKLIARIVEEAPQRLASGAPEHLPELTPRTAIAVTGLKSTVEELRRQPNMPLGLAP